MNRLLFSSTFAGEVIRRRRRAKLSQQKLAELARVSRRTVINIESGKDYRASVEQSIRKALVYVEELKGLSK